MPPFRLKPLLVLAVLPLLAACEYEGAAFIINGNKDENISLVREQKWFWSSDVDQAVVVSRMPTCMRRYDIKQGVSGTVKMEVFEAGASLWALKQGKSWYLASTDKCEFQRWTEPPDEPPGRLVGTFSRKNDKLEFLPAEGSAKPGRNADE